MTLPVGSKFAGFTVVKLIGAGGMGEVYLARHPRLPRQDALKILPTEVSAHAEYRERFLREADLASTLYHPHIVGVHDRGESDSQLWISMDYVDGQDAAHLLRSRYPAGMPRSEVIEIVSAIAGALDYAHEHGLLHRDVKPANILLANPRGGTRRILLADFGIARGLDEISGLTATNMTVGTVSYASPEQLMDEPVDGRADQYSLAATAYHLLTGKPPFEHSNPAVVISHHLNSEPKAASSHQDNLADLDPVLTRALSKSPAERYRSCGDFSSALAGGSAIKSTRESLHQAETRQAPVAFKAPTSAPRAANRSRLRAALAGLGVLTVISGLVTTFMLWPKDMQQQTHSPGAAVAATSRTTDPFAPLAPTPAPPSASTPTITTPPEPTHEVGTPCDHATMNTTALNSSGSPVRCMNMPGGFSWQPDTGEQPDAALVGQGGWANCVREFPQSKCVASAAVLAGSSNTSGPVYPEGSYVISQAGTGAIDYGTYSAAVGPGRSCSYTVLDSTGKAIDSQFYSNWQDQPKVEITPMATNGSFRTVGCSPWVMIEPLSPNW